MTKKQLLIPAVIAIVAMGSYLIRSDASTNRRQLAQQFDSCGFCSAQCGQSDAGCPPTAVGGGQTADCCTAGAGCCFSACCGVECCAAECCGAECCATECCGAECCGTECCGTECCAAKCCSANSPRFPEPESHNRTESCDGLATCCQSSDACCDQ